MELKAIEVDMFEDIAIDPLVLCSKLKQQQDSTRKKVFAKFNDYEERLEILNLQIQMLLDKFKEFSNNSK